MRFFSSAPPYTTRMLKQDAFILFLIFALAIPLVATALLPVLVFTWVCHYARRRVLLPDYQTECATIFMIMILALIGLVWAAGDQYILAAILSVIGFVTGESKGGKKTHDEFERFQFGRRM